MNCCDAVDNASNTVVLCPNPFRDTKLELTEMARDILLSEGFETAICPVFGRDEKSVIPPELEIIDWDKAACCAAMFVVIGGDGTVLQTARHIGHCDKPILGINLGTKGFMSELEPDEVELVVNAARGEYIESRRMMLEARIIRGGECVFSDSGLNDAVIHGMGDCIKLTAWCDSDKVMSYSGDGIIIATPTGSTGYSMSAGGPIVEPEAKNFILSPICAHVMGAKNFVLGPDHRITVKTEKLHDRRAFISVDGTKGIELMNNDILEVRQSEKTVNLVHFGTKSFYDSTFDKLLYKNN